MKIDRIHTPDEDRQQARALSEFLRSVPATVCASLGAGNAVARLDEAAVLLDEYQAGLALVTPHPVTRAVLVQWMPADEPPEPGEHVLIDVDEVVARGNGPWIAWCDEQRCWWYADGSLAVGVRAWCHRPQPPSFAWSPVRTVSVTDEEAAPAVA